MSTKRKGSAKEPTATTIYRLKITLKNTKPPIWRRLLVSADSTLGELNCVFQAAMGWTNSHLHQFTIDGMRYSDPQFGLDDYGSPVVDEFSVTLRDAAPDVGKRFLFEYDFGDGWEHDVVVEKIVPAEPGQSYPFCVAGKRACPPEDCGGVWGYAELLEAIADPEHDQHEELLEWVGGEFDPEAFEVEELNRGLISDLNLLASWR